MRACQCLKKVQQARCKNKAEGMPLSVRNASRAPPHLAASHVGAAMSVLQSLGLASSFCMPGDADWPLSSLMALPSAPEKSARPVLCASCASLTCTCSRCARLLACIAFLTPGKLQAYLRQLRAETVNRLAVEGRMFNADGSLNKWWLSFAKRSFMNKNLPS